MRVMHKICGMVSRGIDFINTPKFCKRSLFAITMIPGDVNGDTEHKCFYLKPTAHASVL
eukprot:m.226177 g.226177  ORF g.226177 m.226177 type:complete len:59 (-) comp19219_c0_seq20:2904-3080(-)